MEGDKLMEEDLRIANYIVAFVDVLGQSDAYLKYPSITTDMSPDDMETMRAVIGRALYSLFDFHEEVQKELNIRNADLIPAASSLPTDVYQQYRYHTKPSIGYQRFSDGFVLYMPIDSVVHNPLMAFTHLVTITANIYIMSLMKRAPVRAGIEIGAGTVFRGEIYGPVVALAYHLEEQVASHPRIVVGEGINRYLDSYRGQYRGKGNKIFDESITLCESLLTRDYDGHTIVDALGNTMSRYLDTAQQRKTVFQSVRSYVEQQYEEHCQTRNGKLAQRYYMLLQRLAASEQHWTVETSNGI